ncbi:putative uncharacterized protein [Corynebacterium casei UCMA 3821]|uniref:Uncharacterized protein n=1 Tax=Corynebacterium casei UCMA 3821 TaxID=1110505 RepID=G7HVY7_9CORY|nr:putative uncharacterized protein [Corynebacterium casei UCMA 3821]
MLQSQADNVVARKAHFKNDSPEEIQVSLDAALLHVPF